ncbi:acylphosphatase [Anianabacter salinae]|uniref:acylphosphatase n=1 Tax=Anianabacter salinae TaxID=2851023 RepID=UPI00225E5117|nr:acylphosphatase [Anianabacter salinae]MBV0911331.1 acylphosphatase [Anianabacter salinae]
MTDTTAIRARISGRVQGVGFRAWVQHEAEARGLTGWVRNEGDGSVAALIEGPAARVAEMQALLHHGPDAARVSTVTVEDARPGDAGEGFRITG